MGALDRIDCIDQLASTRPLRDQRRHTVEMALIRQFREDSGSSARPHSTEVDCGWFVLSGSGDERLLQLNTFGSDDRQTAPSVSQTLQINETGARELMEILRAAFGDLT